MQATITSMVDSFNPWLNCHIFNPKDKTHSRNYLSIDVYDSDNITYSNDVNILR
jgi:hypothetical protein